MYKKLRSTHELCKLLLVATLLLPAVVVLADENPAPAAADEPAASNAIVVYKTPTCGCCTKWVDHLRANGFEVDVNTVPNTTPVQARLGVPRQMGSCHTAKVGDYWVEGHVPAEIIQKLIDEKRDDIQGIAVPGMPPGSPGMESPNPVRYDVVAYGKDGKFYKYATVQGKSEL
jgi:hypothetical protein